MADPVNPRFRLPGDGSRLPNGVTPPGPGRRGAPGDGSMLPPGVTRPGGEGGLLPMAVTEAQTQTPNGARSSALQLVNNMSTAANGRGGSVGALTITKPAGGREPYVTTTNVANFTAAPGVQVVINPLQGRTLGALVVANEGLANTGNRNPGVLRTASVTRMGEVFDRIKADAVAPGAPADVVDQASRRLAQEYFNREALLAAKVPPQTVPANLAISDGQFIEMQGGNPAAPTPAQTAFIVNMRAEAQQNVAAVVAATNALPATNPMEIAQRNALTSDAGRAALLRAGAENPALMANLRTATTAVPPVPANITNALNALKDKIPAATRTSLRIASIDRADTDMLAALGGPQPTQGPNGNAAITGNVPGSRDLQV